LVALVAGFIALDMRRHRELHPPDIIDVEVPSALPGHPITRERLVRPDGHITLGYYGDVYVAGLTTREAKAKIATHLRRYLSDEALGLVVSAVDADGKRSVVRKINPYDTNRVSVWVLTKNSPRGGGIERVIQAIRRLY